MNQSDCHLPFYHLKRRCAAWLIDDCNGARFTVTMTRSLVWRLEQINSGAKQKQNKKKVYWRGALVAYFCPPMCLFLCDKWC